MTLSSLLRLWLFSGLFLIAFGVSSAEPEPGLNQSPSADAGLGRSAMVGEVVTLDASGSTDSDGDWLSFRWTLKTPLGSGARLSDAGALRPHFTVDLLGDYTAELIVNDGKLDSVANSVTIRTANVAPVAIADWDRTVNLGETVMLDGSQSWDVNGDVLDYRWSLVEAPAGSRAVLQSSRSVRPVFATDIAGDYIFELTVSDGQYRSKATQMRLTTLDSRPRADAGPDRNTYAGTRIRLDGRESADADGAPLQYRWSLLHAPGASPAILSGADTATPFVSIDAPGLYLVQLIVNDGMHQGEPDTIVIAATDQPLLSPNTAVTRGGGQDVDGDGIPDDSDNCAEDFNPSQLDSNGDGFGNQCDTDLDNDGFIANFGDLAILRGVFFTTPVSPNWNPDADFNGDNVVNFIDLQVMRAAFFGPPGPIVNRFINPLGGSWHEATNWSRGIVPNQTHTVRIDIGDGVSVEYSTGISTIGGLRSSTDFAISGGTLRVNGNMQVNAAFSGTGSGILADANILAATTLDEIVVPASASFVFENVTLGADVTIESGASLFVDDNLTLSGATITLASNNQFTYLRFRGVSGGSSTLGGTGEVVFGGTTTLNNRNNIEVYNSTDSLVVGPDVTIRTGATGGQLYHRINNGAVTIEGTVLSNVAGATITISGVPLMIEGTLQGLNGGNLTLTPTGTGSSFTGAATMSGGGTLLFNAAAATVWSIDGSFDVNGGELALYGGWTSTATITVTDGLLDIGNTNTAEWDNNGTITLTNSTAELGGRFAAADAGTINTTGDVIIDGTLDNNGQTFDADIDLAGNVMLGTGGVIEAGSVITTPLTVVAGASFTFDNLTLGADVTIESGASLFVDDNLTLSGATITLASNNQFTYLRFRGVSDGSSTLGGTGEVVFGGTTTLNNRNNIEVYNSTDSLVVGPDVTIRTGATGGQLYHRINNGAVTIEGTVLSNVAGATITISGVPLMIEGTLQGLNGGNLTLTPTGTGSSFTGAATMSGGGTLLFNAAAATVWSIDGSFDVNGGELALYGSWTSTATITVTDGLLDIGNTNTAEWDNNGTITLTNSTAELGGRFAAADAGTINTTGDVIIDGTLDNNGQTFDADMDLAGNVMLGTGGVIEAGSVITTPLTVVAGASFTFDNLTLGADVTIESGASLFVDDNLTLSGATITLASNNQFTYLRFRGVSDGSSTLGGTGEVVFGGTTTLNNRNNIEVYNSTDSLVVGPDVTIRTGATGGQLYHRINNGAVTIEGTVLSNVAGATITISGVPLMIEGTLQGLNGGNLTLTPTGTGSSFTGAATMSGGGTLLFNAAAATVWSIDGSFDVNGGELALYGGWTSTATITVTDGLLDIGNTNTAEWDNNGTITLTNSTAELGGRFAAADAGTINTTGDVIIDGTLDNNGQTFDADIDLAGNVMLGTGGVIEAGSVITTPLTVVAGASFTFDNLTLGADVTIESGASLFVDDNLTLSGATITLASNNQFTYLRFRGVSDGSSTLGGTGEVVFGGTTTLNNRNNIEVYNSTDSLVVGPDVTIRTGATGGQLYHRINNGAVTIEGTVLSNVAGATITISGVPLMIEGTLQGLNGGNLTLTPTGTGSSFTGAATMSGGGTLLFNAAAATVWSIDGSFDVNGGELALYGGWTSTATITVTDGLLDIGNTNTAEWDNNGTITLTNSTAELGGRFAAADAGTINTTGDVIIDGTLDNNGQTFDADMDLAGNVMLGTGGVIEAGSVITTPLTVVAGASFTFDNLTLGADVTIESGASLFVDDNLTLSGATITLASNNQFTYLRFRGVSDGSSTLGGTGEVVFGGTTTLNNRNNIEVYNSTDSLVVGPDVTIRTGATGGQLYHRINNGAVTIEGTVLSNVAGATITISGVPLSIEGNLQAGAGSVINFTSDYSLTATATLDVEIGGTATTEFGRYTAVGRTANLDGTINMTLVNAFMPALNDTFEILTFAGRIDTIAPGSGTTIGGGLFFQVNNNTTDVTLEVVN